VVGSWRSLPGKATTFINIAVLPLPTTPQNVSRTTPPRPIALHTAEGRSCSRDRACRMSSARTMQRSVSPTRPSPKPRRARKVAIPRRSILVLIYRTAGVSLPCRVVEVRAWSTAQRADTRPGRSQGAHAHRQLFDRCPALRHRELSRRAHARAQLQCLFASSCAFVPIGRLHGQHTPMFPFSAHPPAWAHKIDSRCETYTLNPEP